MIKGSISSDKGTRGSISLAGSPVEIRQDLGDRPFRDRIDGRRRDFRERLEDEPAGR